MNTKGTREANISSFQFLEQIERTLSQELVNDAAFAIGHFESRRTLDFNNNSAQAQLLFTEEGAHQTQPLVSMRIECVSDREAQYAFQGNISCVPLGKQKFFTIVISDGQRLCNESLKLALYAKSFLAEALKDKLLQEPTQSAKVIATQQKAVEHGGSAAQERTIQMSPQELQRQLMEEAQKDAAAGDKSKDEPLPLSTQDIEKILQEESNQSETPGTNTVPEALAQEPKPSDPPAAAPAGIACTENISTPSPALTASSNEPLNMSTADVEKMLFGEK